MGTTAYSLKLIAYDNDKLQTTDLSSKLKNFGEFFKSGKESTIIINKKYYKSL